MSSGNGNRTSQLIAAARRKELWKNVEEILIFSLSVGSAYSVMFALYDTIDPAADKTNIGVSLLYAVAVHSVCTCFAVFVIASTSIPHEVEETVLLPIGLLPGLMWNAAISDWLGVVEEVPGVDRFESILLFVCSALAVQILISAFIVTTSQCLFGTLKLPHDTIKNRSGAKKKRDEEVGVLSANKEKPDGQTEKNEKIYEETEKISIQAEEGEELEDEEEELEEEGLQLSAFDTLREWPEDTYGEIINKYATLWLGCFVRILPMAMMETIALSWRKPLYLLVNLNLDIRCIVAVPIIFIVELGSVHFNRHRENHQDDSSIFARICDRFRFFIFTTGFFNIAYVLMAVPKELGTGVTNLSEALALDLVSIIITGALCFGKAYAFAYFPGWAEHEHKGHGVQPSCTWGDLKEDLKETCHVLSEALDTMLGIALGLFFTDMVRKNKIKNLHVAVLIRWAVVAVCVSIIMYLVHRAHQRIIEAIQMRVRIMLFISKKMKAFRQRIKIKREGLDPTHRRRRMGSIVLMKNNEEPTEQSALLGDESSNKSR